MSRSAPGACTGQWAGPAPGARRRLLAARALAILGGLLAPLVALEIAIRTFGPFLPGYYDTGSFLARHPTLGHFHVPGFDGWRRAPEFTTRIRFSRLGLRDPRQEYEKPAGVFRVLMLGDSFVEGIQVEEDRVVAAQLESLLRDTAARPVEVINAGVGGYGTGQELLLLESEGVRYRPDLIVLTFFAGNDLANNNYRLELWDEDLRLALKPYWEIERDGTLRVIPPPPPRPPSGVVPFLRHCCLLFNVIETGLVNKFSWAPPGEPVDAIGGLRQPIRGQYDTSPQGEWQRAWRVTEALLQRVRARAEQMGVPLVLVGIPESRALDPEVWRREVAGDRASSGRLQPTAPTDRLGDIAARLGVPYLDLLPPLVLAHREGDEPLYYQYDRHWTTAGHRVAAIALADFLRREQLVP